MIKFELSEDLLFVQGKVQQLSQHASVSFIIDTAAGGSAVDVNLITPDYSRHSRFAEISGVGGGESVLIQKVDLIQLGSIHLQDIELQFGDLENSFGVQGIIGNNILARYRANIDYTSSRLSLAMPGFIESDRGS